jgi:hypothetical protein
MNLSGHKAAKASANEPYGNIGSGSVEIDKLPHATLASFFGRGPATTPFSTPACSVTLRMIFPLGSKSSAFQHHVRLSCIGGREDRTDACFQFITINKFGNSAQPLSGYFHQEESCGDAMVLCAVLIRLGHVGDQFTARAKNLKRTCLRFAPRRDRALRRHP